MFKEDFGWAHENTCDQMKTCFFHCIVFIKPECTTSNITTVNLEDIEDFRVNKKTLEKSLKLKKNTFLNILQQHSFKDEWEREKMCGRETTKITQKD